MTTIVKRVELTASQENILHDTLRKLLSSSTKTGTGKYMTDTIRFEMDEDQYKDLLLVFGQL